jgi:hypothetical protein
MKSTGSFEAIKGNDMDIVNFFEKLEGNWFSQRTTHFAPGQTSKTGQTTLQMARLEPHDPRVAGLCQQFFAQPQDAVFAFHIQQEGQSSTYGAATTSPSKTTILVGLKSVNGESGQFLSQTEQEPAVSGQYQLENEVLTLLIENDGLQSEERLWFMNPNLRMRTSLLKTADGFQMASFCSEIRRLS